MRRKWLKGALAITAAALIVAACSDSEPTPPPTGGSFEVVYKVVSTDQDAAELTYTYNGGSDVFRGTESLPFEEAFTMAEGDLVDIGALSLEGTTVTCRIDIDGRKYRENTASGGTAAVCQGQVTSEP
jgi:hypothetical protein